MAKSIIRSLSDDRYQVTFSNHEIDVILTHLSKNVRRWISYIILGMSGWRCSHCDHPRIANRPIVGLDIEWLPEFRSNGQRTPVAVLQLCVGEECLIFQLLYAEKIPNALVTFLGDDDYTFVGVGIHNDAKKLLEDYNLKVANIVDLSKLASQRFRNPELRNVGLIDLASQLLGMEYKKPKSITISKWDKPNLSDAQVKYACIDAFLSYSVGLSLDADKH